MDEKQIRENGFVREKIKDKPKNHKRIWKRLGMSAACGVVFALGACLVFFFTRPFLTDQKQVAAESQTEETQSVPVTEEPEETEEPEKDTEEETESSETKQPVTLEDYQQIQTQLYAIGNIANKSIVGITSVVSDTDWFNNAYEREGQGSGTIIGETDEELYILTEKKTITDASEITVTFIDDTAAPASLVRYDGNTGLAALTVQKKDLASSTQNAISVMEMASKSSVHKGSIVIALGSPLGTNYSILTGNITANNNEISTPDKNYSVYTTDIVASKSGSGVLINTDGELVGIVMLSYGTDSGSTLTAVDVTELEPVIDLLFADKDVPYLGVHISTVTDLIAQKYGLPQGVYIKEVEMDSPAMDAGLQSGDVLVSLAGQEVATDAQFSEVLLGLTPGETYSAVVMREGASGYQEITCKFEAGVLQ